MEIPATQTLATQDFSQWLKEKEFQELEFQNVTKINSTVKVIGQSVSSSSNDDKVKELEEKLAKVSQAYTELRGKHEDLLKEHQKLV